MAQAKEREYACAQQRDTGTYIGCDGAMKAHGSPLMDEVRIHLSIYLSKPLVKPGATLRVMRNSRHYLA